jgi:hypothetical protein
VIGFGFGKATTAGFVEAVAGGAEMGAGRSGARNGEIFEKARGTVAGAGSWRRAGGIVEAPLA